MQMKPVLQHLAAAVCSYRDNALTLSALSRTFGLWWHIRLASPDGRMLSAVSGARRFDECDSAGDSRRGYGSHSTPGYDPCNARRRRTVGRAGPAHRPADVNKRTGPEIIKDVAVERLNGNEASRADLCHWHSDVIAHGIEERRLGFCHCRGDVVVTSSATGRWCRSRLMAKSTRYALDASLRCATRRHVVGWCRFRGMIKRIVVPKIDAREIIAVILLILR